MHLKYMPNTRWIYQWVNSLVDFLTCKYDCKCENPSHKIWSLIYKVYKIKITCFDIQPICLKFSYIHNYYNNFCKAHVLKSSDIFSVYGLWAWNMTLSQIWSDQSMQNCSEDNVHEILQLNILISSSVTER